MKKSSFKMKLEPNEIKPLIIMVRAQTLKEKSNSSSSMSNSKNSESLEIVDIPSDEDPAKILDRGATGETNHLSVLTTSPTKFGLKNKVLNFQSSFEKGRGNSQSNIRH
jgi:hypothetical protein